MRPLRAENEGKPPADPLKAGLEVMGAGSRNGLTHSLKYRSTKMACF